MKFIYPAIIRKEENGTFKATFPDLACCEAIGDSLDDVIEKANEAAVGWLELELSEEMPMLPPVTEPFWSSMPKKDFVNTDLPEPDSPTMASVSPS